MNRKLTWLREWHENVRPEVEVSERKATVCAATAASVIGEVFGEIVTLAEAKI